MAFGLALRRPPSIPKVPKEEVLVYGERVWRVRLPVKDLWVNLGREARIRPNWGAIVAPHIKWSIGGFLALLGPCMGGLVYFTFYLYQQVIQGLVAGPIVALVLAPVLTWPLAVRQRPKAIWHARYSGFKNGMLCVTPLRHSGLFRQKWDPVKVVADRTNGKEGTGKAKAKEPTVTPHIYKADFYHEVKEARDIREEMRPQMSSLQRIQLTGLIILVLSMSGLLILFTIALQEPRAATGT